MRPRARFRGKYNHSNMLQWARIRQLEAISRTTVSDPKEAIDSHPVGHMRSRDRERRRGVQLLYYNELEWIVHITACV